MFERCERALYVSTLYEFLIYHNAIVVIVIFVVVTVDILITIIIVIALFIALIMTIIIILITSTVIATVAITTTLTVFWSLSVLANWPLLSSSGKPFVWLLVN